MAEPVVRALVALARAQAAKASAQPPDDNDDESDERPQDRAVVALLAAWFASKDAIAAMQLPTRLIDALVGLGVDRQAATKAGEMVLSKPLTGRSRHGAPDLHEGMPAARRVAAQEPRYRAEYLLAAARRLTEALKQDRYDQALQGEERFLDAHVAAGRKRRAAARRVDDLGKDGQVLVWRAVLDDRTTPECAALNGRLFTADDPPGIPGAMHSRCRCTVEVWGRGPLVGSGKAASAGETKADAEPFVMIIRHGEKPEDSAPYRGVKEKGKPDEDSLTTRGWSRAGALATLFAPSTSPVREGLARPNAIYASGGDHGEGRRTRQTVRALAARLGLTVNTSFTGYGEGSDDAALAAEAGNRPGPTLICWRHEDIPHLAKSFGRVTPEIPDPWPDERFDVVWTLTPDGDGGWTFDQVPQLLLDGDSDEPIE